MLLFSARTGKAKKKKKNEVIVSPETLKKNAIAMLDTRLKQIDANQRSLVTAEQRIRESGDTRDIDNLRKIRDTTNATYSEILGEYDKKLRDLDTLEITPLQTQYNETLNALIKTTQSLEEQTRYRETLKQRHLAHERAPISDEMALDETWLTEEALFYMDLKKEVTNNRLALATSHEQAEYYRNTKNNLESRLMPLFTMREQMDQARITLAATSTSFANAYHYLDMAPDALVRYLQRDNDIETETEKKQNTLRRVATLLRTSQFDALKSEFNQEWQKFFLVQLFAYYSKPETTTISDHVPLLIAFMTESYGEQMYAIHEILRAKDKSHKERESEITTLLKSFSITNRDGKIAVLVHEAHRLDKFRLLRYIEALITDASGMFVAVDDPDALHEERNRVERLKAMVQFRHYELATIVKQPPLALDETAQLYRAMDRRTKQPVLIKVVSITARSDTTLERRAHERLTTIPGFARLVTHFRLEKYPFGVLERASSSSHKKKMDAAVIVYVTEAPDVDIDLLRTATDEDRRCALFEMVYALREAKRLYGAQHNNIHAEMLNFNGIASPRAREYHLDDNGPTLYCRSSHRVLLLHYGFVTLDAPEQQRTLLSGLDYEAIRHLLLDSPLFQLDARYTQVIKTLLTQHKESIAFDVFLRALE